MEREGKKPSKYVQNALQMEVFIVEFEWRMDLVPNLINDSNLLDLERSL
jgi:hypothetical protein